MAVTVKRPLASMLNVTCMVDEGQQMPEVMRTIIKHRPHNKNNSNCWNLDLRHAPWRGWYGCEVEAAQPGVVARELALALENDGRVEEKEQVWRWRRRRRNKWGSDTDGTSIKHCHEAHLKHLNVHAGLIIHLGCEDFALARGDDGVALDDDGHDAACTARHVIHGLRTTTETMTTSPCIHNDCPLLRAECLPVVSIPIDSGVTSSKTMLFPPEVKPLTVPVPVNSASASDARKARRLEPVGIPAATMS